MKTRFFQILTLLLAACPLLAQPGKVDKALDGFLKTEFMQQFLDLRAEAEAAARGFQKVADQYQPMQAQKIESGYEQTANHANGILRGIVADFSDSKKMKYIADYPDHYAKGLKADLQELSTAYANRFRQPLAELTKEETDGMPWLLAVTQLISLTSQLVDHIGKVRLEKRRFTQEYLDAHLYQPFRFHTWEESANSSSLESDPYQIRKDEREVFNPLDSLPMIDTSGSDEWEEPPGAGNSTQQKVGDKQPGKKRKNDSSD